MTITKIGGRSESLGLRLLASVERAGNALPHPFWLFWILFGVLAVASWILSNAGVQVTDPATGETVGVNNALSVEAIRSLLTGAEESFVTFGPLGTVLIVMLGVAVADRSGLFEVIARRALSNVSPRSVVFAVALGGALSKFLSDSAYVVLIPLGAVAFKAVGRSPMLGMIVAFVSINAAGDANPLIAPGDVVFAKVATEAAHLIDPNVTVRATDNMYFTTVSAIVLAITVTLVTELILKKREHTLVVDSQQDDTAALSAMAPSALLSDEQERRGLRVTGFSAVAFLALLAAAIIPAGSPLRGEGGEFLESPFLDGIAFFLSMFFLVLGTAFAAGSRQLDSASDIPRFMADGVRSIAPLIVLFFAVSQFLALFKFTKISTVVAVVGSDAIQGLGVNSVGLFLIVVVCIAVLNLMITSGQALWALVAPVIVPMMMLLGTNPATTMALYRIADSCTNSITPMSTSFVLCVGYLQTLNKKAGIGTLISFTLPCALIMFVVWLGLFLAWWALGIPLGPGAPVR
ncbi:AbgT family transporter [Paeniglutamicibacter sp. ZC-3]|uniref:AbgT family transporter n=1 Tax=Paeniglutamicibacter sp. ZC-3 TaxID=2986919 RepID=UPI0021F7BF08|nr:AbgT family transporter [Paeniglutamicibacter sp. ZC-3]MCV9996311.1 AbgT family transporter [Paeniglutamicibacter sp. ZC-3]